jgi:hypothetical protein
MWQHMTGPPKASGAEATGAIPPDVIPPPVQRPARPTVDIRKPGSLQAAIDHELDFGAPSVATPAPSAPAPAALPAPAAAAQPNTFDRWLSDPMTDMGFRMMASRQPSVAGMFGEAGVGASQDAIRRRYIDAEQKFRQHAQTVAEAHQKVQETQGQQQIDAMRDYHAATVAYQQFVAQNRSVVDAARVKYWGAMGQKALRGPAGGFNAQNAVTKAMIDQAVKGVAPDSYADPVQKQKYQDFLDSVNANRTALPAGARLDQ